MHKLNQIKLKPGLRTFHAIWPGKGLGLFWSARSPHRAET